MNETSSAETFDLVVVGASFAGLVCARTAAMRGMRVAVIEAKKDPGTHIRTTGILVKEAADELDVPANLCRKVRGVRIYAPNLTSEDLFAPGYYFLTTDTADLLRWLARNAWTAGSRMFFGTRFTSAVANDGYIYLSQPRIRTRYLVGADGARSNVARHFGLDANNKFLTGVEWEFEQTGNVDGRFLHCFVDQKLAPGYMAWVVPGVIGVQVGLAASRPHKPQIQDLLERLEPLFHLSDQKVLDRRSGVIPVGGRVTNFYRPGVMLIGDAAGWVSPLTAGGIRLAFQYGRRAAQVISDHLFDKGGDPGAVLSQELPKLALKHAMRFAYENLAPNWVLNSTLMTPPMLALARRVYFHRRGTYGSHFDQYTDHIDTKTKVPWVL